MSLSCFINSTGVGNTENISNISFDHYSNAAALKVTLEAKLFKGLVFLKAIHRMTCGKRQKDLSISIKCVDDEQRHS